jgi:predicted nucleic acid-binding Zn ribbon protein
MKRRNAQTIGEALTDFLSGNPDLRRRVMAVRVQQAWGEVLGPSILQYTRNIYIKDRVMYVSLNSAVLRNELVLSRDRLLRSLNEYVGEEVIKGLVIR